MADRAVLDQIRASRGKTNWVGWIIGGVIAAGVLAGIITAVALHAGPNVGSVVVLAKPFGADCNLNTDCASKNCTLTKKCGA